MEKRNLEIASVITADMLSTSELESLQEVREQIAQAQTAQEIREIGQNIQSHLTQSHNRILETARVFDAGDIGTELNKVVMTTHQITSKVALPRPLATFMNNAKMMTARNAKVTDQLDKLQSGADVIVTKLTASLDFLQQARMALAEDVSMLAPVIVALTESAEVDKQNFDAMVEGSAEQVDAEYRLAEKYQRIRELTTHMVIARQQGEQATLIQQANFQWVKEVQHAVSQALPLFQMSVLQAIGLDAGKKAARTVELLHSAVDTALVNTAKQLANNVSSLSAAHTSVAASPAAVKEAQKYLDTAYAAVQETKHESIAKHQEAMGTLVTLNKQLVNRVMQLNQLPSGDGNTQD